MARCDVLLSKEIIRDNYYNDMDAINKYMETVKLLLFSLCNTKDDLIVELPVLYRSIGSGNLSDNYNDIRIEIEQLREKINKEINMILVDNEGDYEISPDDPTADGDLLLYFYTEIAKGNKDREELFKSSQSVLEVLCNTKGPLIHGDRFYELYDNSELVYRLIDIAINNNAYREKIKLKKKLETINQIEKSIDLFDLSALMNIYRQCFLQIMSYFDNSVFELLKVYMQDDYFYWLDKFKNTSIKTHDMAKFSSFEDFRDEHIDELLKSCYVKDLLSIVHGIDFTVFEENGADIFKEIQEAIGRRNVHIHNNGIADKAYIDGFNIYGLQKGDFLTIDELVVRRIQALTRMIINNLSEGFTKKNP